MFRATCMIVGIGGRAAELQDMYMNPDALEEFEASQE